MSLKSQTIAQGTQSVKGIIQSRRFLARISRHREQLSSSQNERSLSFGNAELDLPGVFL
jgi:hypothetical protein